MPKPKHSSAVQSMEIEQAKQREGASKPGLDTGLEDSFPASDPVSATQTAVPAGRADTDEADSVRRQPMETDEAAPLVHDALQSTGEGHRSDPSRDSRDAPGALRREADHKASAMTKVESVGEPLVKSEPQTFVKSVEDKIRERPLAAVVVVAALAFVFGATR
ncbi:MULTISPECIES: hypothetical protein [unclassified Rhizobium]|uniref:hypothetical protein n=1 Tax=unclassified Rhizobium TaxID=2613769 RepID=UPI0037F47AE4